MSLGVLNNINAIYASNNLNNTNNSLSKVLSQLSSGSKINSGSDDAAGLSLVNGLQANSQALAQSQTNVSSGLGLLKVADGALSQVTNLLNRAVSLATQAANGTLNDSQNAAANQEYQSILAEINNIGSTTTYNQRQVFGSTTKIYTGDSSTLGSSLNALNISTLSSSRVGDRNGQMGYSNGGDNIFIDLSKNGKNAAATDSLGTSSQTTTIAVNYLAKGADGSAVSASANISVGSGTSYDNTVQGLISAINDSGLGLTASFGTATQAGTASANAALDASYIDSTLKSSGTDTGIIITGTGIGVNTTGSNGAGEIGDITVNNSGDKLAGTMTLVDSSGTSHTVALGVAKSTDTLANLASTINSSGYGITARVDTTNGTTLTLVSASSKAGVSMTNATNTAATTTTLSLGASSGTAGALGYIPATITVNSSTDELSGVLVITPAAAGTTPAASRLNVQGMTLQDVANSINNSSGDFNWSSYGMTASVSADGKTLSFVTSIANGGSGQNLGVAISNTSLQDHYGTTTGAIVQQTNQNSSNGVVLATGAFGTISLTNADDTLTGGTIKIAGQSFTLGTSGSTDNLQNLVATINANTAVHTTADITAALSADGKTVTLTAGASGAVATNVVSGTNVTSSLALTGTPQVANEAGNQTNIATISLASGSSAGSALGGSLVIGSTTIDLSGGTYTLSSLTDTINTGNYGVNATLSSDGTKMTLTSPNSSDADITVTNGITTAAGNAVKITGNNGVQSSSYYNVGISGTVADTSTGGGTSTIGISANHNGSGGIATISYSSSAGQSLAGTDLTTQTNAQSTLQALNTAIADVAAMDGYIGAQINTLSAVSSVLSTQQENVTSAQNAVQATDYAAAASALSKYMILSQTGISALAQANSLQQEVTKLLQ